MVHVWENFPDLNGLAIGVIGLGYVGLPLAVTLSKVYNVVAYDKNQRRIDQLNVHNDVTREVSKKELLERVNLTFTSDLESLRNCRCFIIAVPTPIDAENSPDLGPLISASKLVGGLIKSGDVVIYESTVFPGCTEEVCVPIIEDISGLAFNKEFFCGYSPERINPGDKKRTIQNIIKVTSGSNEQCADFVDSLYKKVITAGTFKTVNIRTAEAAKVIENTQRDLNIAFVNELAIICDKLNLNTNDVLQAAGSKWNFLSFKPGLVGGHCIGVDPYYLTFKSKQVGHVASTILAGRAVNDSMARFIAKKVVSELKNRGLPPKESKILILGLTFKENCPDTRNSKVFGLIDVLVSYGCDVEVWDPLIHSSDLPLKHQYQVIVEPKCAEYDAIICAVAHNIFLDIPKSQIFSWKKEKRSFVYDVKSCLGEGISDLQL